MSRLLFTLPGSDEAPTLDTCADEPETELEQELARILRHYFQGKPVDFSSVPIVWTHGTEFQQQAWETLRTIPAGETWNYGEQATAMDRKKAVRAVGQANRNNPIPIIVPCHRVVAASGKLQGYGGQSYGSTGLHIKGFLIQLEQAALGQAELPTFYPSWVEAASNKM